MYEKPVLISFDLSTVTIGISIFDFKEEKLLDLYYYKFVSNNMLDKSIELEDFIDKLDKVYQIDWIIIEERLKSFRAGGTNAASMLKLAAFNWFCQALLYKRKIKFKEINVNTARSLAYDHFHVVARKIKGIKQKEYAFQLVLSELGTERFPTKINKSGKNKGKEVFLEEAKDMADAYILSKAAFKILKPTII